MQLAVAGYIRCATMMYHSIPQQHIHITMLRSGYHGVQQVMVVAGYIMVPDHDDIRYCHSLQHTVVWMYCSSSASMM